MDVKRKQEQNKRLDEVLKDLFPGYTDVHACAKEIVEFVQENELDLVLEQLGFGVSDIPRAGGGKTIDKLSDKTIGKIFKAAVALATGVTGGKKSKSVLKKILGQHYKELQSGRKVTNFRARAKAAIRKLREAGARPKLIEKVEDFAIEVEKNKLQNSAFAAGVISSAVALADSNKGQTTAIAVIMTAQGMNKGESFNDAADKAIRTTGMQDVEGERAPDDEPAKEVKGELYPAKGGGPIKIEGLSLLQMIEQDVSGLKREKKGISIEDLTRLWRKAGEPRTPEQLVNFLKKQAGLDNEDIAQAFDQGANMKLDYAGFDAPEYLEDETVETLQKFFAQLDSKELKGLYDAVAKVKEMSGEELRSAEHAKRM